MCIYEHMYEYICKYVYIYKVSKFTRPSNQLAYSSSVSTTIFTLQRAQIVINKMSRLKNWKYKVDLHV